MHANLESYGIFAVSCTILALIPGPNVALIVAGSLSHGTRQGLYTVAGGICAMAVQLGLVTLGLSTIALFVATWFEGLRWIGVAYLFYLGISYWKKPSPPDSAIVSVPENPFQGLRRGFLTAIANPKILLFLGAFLPQFVTDSAHVLPQMGILCLIFIAVVATVDSSWAALAGMVRPFILKTRRSANKIAALFFLFSTLLLLLIRR